MLVTVQLRSHAEARLPGSFGVGGSPTQKVVAVMPVFQGPRVVEWTDDRVNEPCRFSDLGVPL